MVTHECKHAQPHRMLHICREQIATRSAMRVARVRRAIAYLMNKGESAAPHGQDFTIHCEKFMLCAFDILSRAPLEFLSTYRDVWRACGVMGGTALKSGLTDVASEMCPRFSDKFSAEPMPWSVRASIIEGFAELASYCGKQHRDQYFWNALDYFAAYCRAAVACTGKNAPAEIKRCVRALIHVWWKLAKQTGGLESDVREKAAAKATDLLDILTQSGDLASFDTELWDKLSKWQYMLQNLLPPKAAQDWRASERERVQEHFNKLAGKLVFIKPEHPDQRTAHNWARMMSTLQPFLHGQPSRGDRRMPVIKSEVSVVIGGETVPGIVCDICARTCQGMRLELQHVEVDKVYDQDSPACGEVNNQYPRRKVPVSIRLPNRASKFVEVEKMKVDLSRLHAQAALQLDCFVLRAWPLPGAQGGPQSAWAILSADNTPPSWNEYVRSLSQVC
jgi:hypothetical protein